MRLQQCIRCTPPSCRSHLKVCRVQACTCICLSLKVKTTRSTTKKMRTTCRLRQSHLWRVSCATPQKLQRSPTKRSTATSDSFLVLKHPCIFHGLAIIAVVSSACLCRKKVTPWQHALNTVRPTLPRTRTSHFLSSSQQVCVVLSRGTRFLQKPMQTSLK